MQRINLSYLLSELTHEFGITNFNIDSIKPNGGEIIDVLIEAFHDTNTLKDGDMTKIINIMEKSLCDNIEMKTLNCKISENRDYLALYFEF